jgi:hypothetical protein
LPDDVWIVFADDGHVLEMQDDFRTTPREDDRNYGAYYHIAFWTGPHLVQRQTPSKLARNIRGMVAKGDTDYLILNVSNIREHVLGTEASALLWQDPAGFDPDAFLADFAPHGLDAAYREFFDAWFEVSEHRVITDGDVYSLARQVLAKLEKQETDLPPSFPRHGRSEAEARTWYIARLGECSMKLSAVAATPLPAALSEQQRALFDANLRVQAAMLAGYYTWLQQLLASLDNPACLAEAEAALQSVLEVREPAATGAWAGWYTGDRKVGTAALLERTRKIMRARGLVPAG